MSVWFSEYRVRSLAERIAPRIAPRVEAALVAAIRAELPALLLDELRNEIPEHVAKTAGVNRRLRNDAIVAQHNGRNTAELARNFGISTSMVIKIVRGRNK